MSRQQVRPAPKLVPVAVVMQPQETGTNLDVPPVRARLLWCVATVLLAGVSACVHDSGTPGPFGGPSELGLSLSLSASPDLLPLDGTAQAFIGIFARDPNREAVPNLVLTLQIGTTRGFEDFGRLSVRRVVTGSDGRASAIYTAPRGWWQAERVLPIPDRSSPSGSPPQATISRTWCREH